MMLVVVTTAVLSTLAITLLQFVTTSRREASASVKSQESFQAAEAGLDDYLAKLVDDRAYYLHEVHEAESTRRPPSGADCLPGASPGRTPTPGRIPPRRTRGRRCQTGTSTTSRSRRPRPARSRRRSSRPGERSVRRRAPARSRCRYGPSSLADFYRFSDEDVAWGSGANTYGKIYSNGQRRPRWHRLRGHLRLGRDLRRRLDAERVEEVLDLDDARASPRRSRTRSTSRTSSSPSPISRGQRRPVASIYNDPSKAAWRFVFSNNGTFTYRSCTQSGGNDVSKVAPVCGAASAPVNVPANGAIYTGPDRDRRGRGQGARHHRLGRRHRDRQQHRTRSHRARTSSASLPTTTSGSPTTARPCSRGAPPLLVQNNTWHTTSGSPTKTTMNFTGSAATKKGGRLRLQHA